MSKVYTIRLQSLGIRKFEFVAKQKNMKKGCKNSEKGVVCIDHDFTCYFIG